LLDSTIVRVIMVPASMRLMGAANWWMPAWLRRIVPELSEGPAVAGGPIGRLRLGTSDVVLLRTRPLRIGRDSTNDVQILDDRVSRFHAQVDFDPIAGAPVVVDLGSTNGVYVNARRIAGQPASIALHDGDQLDIGGTVLVFETSAQPSGR
jgi:pSer/pThr/pTyr-binding forkhead associated (FHA) protein